MSLSLFAVSPKKLGFFSYKHGCCLLNRKTCSLTFQNGKNVLKPVPLLVSKNDLVLSLRDSALNGLLPDKETRSSQLNTDGELGITKFLRGKNLFLTGATGFLAKVLIEKILRTVPEVGKIFLLIKAESKEAAMQRLQDEIIDVDLFKCLRQTYGKTYQNFMSSKLVPVLGNVGEFNLGLEEHTVEVLGKEIDIIVNSAANTNFHERYDVALDINMRGPYRVMDLAKKCQNLKLFLHVSSVYANGHRQGTIMEKPFRLGDSIASHENITRGAAYRPINALTIENEDKLVLDAKKRFNDNTIPYRMKELGLERS